MSRTESLESVGELRVGEELEGYLLATFLSGRLPSILLKNLAAVTSPRCRSGVGGREAGG